MRAARFDAPPFSFGSSNLQLHAVSVSPKVAMGWGLGTRRLFLSLFRIPVAGGIRSAAAFLLFALVLTPVSADTVDRLGVPGPISFDGKDFQLAWSSQPSPGYFKQEYVPAGQAVETYESMLLLEVVAAGVDVKGALAAQVQMLNQRKGSDPLLNMDVLQNEQTGEAILDFIVSSKDDKGEYIVEWNAYRYAPQGDGVMLFAISHRGYGNEGARTFLGNLRAVRPDQINKLAQ